jgi:hypothetical protein
MSMTVARPPPEIRRLRDLTRDRADLVAARTAEKNRAEKLLEDAQIKLSVVAPDIFGVSGRDMMAVLVAGERSPKVLAQLARKTRRRKTSLVEEAFTGYFTDHHAFLPVPSQVRFRNARISSTSVWVKSSASAIHNGGSAHSEASDGRQLRVSRSSPGSGAKSVCRMRTTGERNMPLEAQHAAVRSAGDASSPDPQASTRTRRDLRVSELMTIVELAVQCRPGRHTFETPIEGSGLTFRSHRAAQETHRPTRNLGKEGK